MPEQRRYPLEIVFDLFEAATEMVAAKYRREHPEASQQEVDAVVSAWVSSRPGAPDGDADGRVISWPRSA